MPLQHIWRQLTTPQITYPLMWTVWIAKHSSKLKFSSCVLLQSRHLFLAYSGQIINHPGWSGASPCLLLIGPQPIMTGPGVFCYQASALLRENLISALLVIIMFYYTCTPPGAPGALFHCCSPEQRQSFIKLSCSLCQLGGRLLYFSLRQDT